MACGWGTQSAPSNLPDELTAALEAIANVPDRVGQLGDIWAHILDARVDLRQLLLRFV
jgi:hypothetical protein